ANETSVFCNSPDVIERDLHRLEDAVGGEQQQEDGKDVHLTPVRQVIVQELPQRVGKEIGQSQIDSCHCSCLVENQIRQRHQHDQERKKRQQNVGCDRKRVDVDFGPHPVAKGRLQSGHHLPGCHFFLR